MRKTAFFLLFAMLTTQALADALQHTPPAQVISGTPLNLEFETTGIAGVPVEVELRYRTEEMEEWIILDLLGQWDNELLQLTLEPLPFGSHFLEYYLQLTTAEGGSITCPELVPQTSPFRIDIKEPALRTDARPFALCGPLEFEPDEQVLIAISLQEPIAAEDLHIQLGGEDITSLCVTDPWLITYLPTPAQPQQGALVIQWRQSPDLVTTWQMGSVLKRKARTRGYRLQASTFETIHFEQVADRWENYHRVGGNLSWEQGRQKLSLVLNLAVRDLQENQLQPQSRFTVKYQVPMLTLEAGDVYPRVNQLVLQGTRMRGAQVDFRSQVFSLQAMAGLLRHEILDDDTAQTLARTLIAVAPRFGNYRKISTGLVLMKSWDQKRDNTFVHPQENLVLGGDFTMRVLQQRLTWTTEAAFSLSNTNTAEPVLSDADLDTLSWDWPGFLPTPEQMESIFTINPYLSPTNPLGLTSLAWQSRLQANFPGNTLTLRWRHLGTDYESFGNGGIMNDQQGFEVTDGFRLLSRQFYIHLAGRSYRDNLNGGLDNSWGTTRNSAWQTNVSWYPTQNWPTVHLSGQLTQRKNDVASNSDYYTNLTGNNVNLRVDHPFEWLNFTHRLNSQLTYYNLVEDTAEGDADTLTAGSRTWQLSSTLRTELNNRMDNRLYLSYSASEYETGSNSSYVRLQNKLRYRWSDKIDYVGGLGLRLVNGDDSYIRWRAQVGGNWRWRENFNFNLQLQQVFYTGSDNLQPDLRFVLRLEQLLFNS